MRLAARPRTRKKLLHLETGRSAYGYFVNYWLPPIFCCGFFIVFVACAKKQAKRTDKWTETQTRIADALETLVRHFTKTAGEQ